MTTFRLILFLILPFQLLGQSEVEAGGMHFRYEVKDDSLICFISSPSLGWAMIGLNSKNTTEYADFKFFAVKDHKVIISDNKNIGERNYPKDTDLKGQQNIKLLEGKEVAGSSQFYFSIPLKSKDKNDYQIEFDIPFYLILAYSESDDFEHHSRVREHYMITLTQ